MKVAKVAFWGKEGVGQQYSYSCEGFEAGLLKGDWVVVTSARSKYSLGIFMGYDIIDKAEDIAIVTQRVVGITAPLQKEKGV